MNKICTYLFAVLSLTTTLSPLPAPDQCGTFYQPESHDRIEALTIKLQNIAQETINTTEPGDQCALRLFINLNEEVTMMNLGIDFLGRFKFLEKEFEKTNQSPTSLALLSDHIENYKAVRLVYRENFEQCLLQEPQEESCPAETTNNQSYTASFISFVEMYGGNLEFIKEFGALEAFVIASTLAAFAAYYLIKSSSKNVDEVVANNNNLNNFCVENDECFLNNFCNINAYNQDNQSPQQ